MLPTRKTAVIGCGHLGRAIVRGLLDSDYIGPGDTIASARTTESVVRIARELGIEACCDNSLCLQEGRMVILTATPAAFLDISAELKSIDAGGRVLLSAIGGVPFSVLARQFKTVNVIRFMPTIAVAQREGPVVWMARPGTDAEARRDARALFECLGTPIEVSDERLVDLSSMLSSCALAYYYLLCEAVADQGPKLGFSEREAEIITRLGLLASAVHLKHQEGARAAVAGVATRSGVTEAAVEVFRRRGLSDIAAEAVDAARSRLVGFSKAFDDSPFADDEV
jgi:pyrroline-5-carboxylate reductase